MITRKNYIRFFSTGSTSVVLIDLTMRFSFLIDARNELVIKEKSVSRSLEFFSILNVVFSIRAHYLVLILQ